MRKSVYCFCSFVLKFCFKKSPSSNSFPGECFRDGIIWKRISQKFCKNYRKWPAIEHILSKGGWYAWNFAWKTLLDQLFCRVHVKDCFCCKCINPFHATGLLPYLLKTSENHRLSYVSQGV